MGKQSGTTRSNEATPGRQAGSKAGASHRPPGAASSDLAYHPLSELLPMMTSAEREALRGDLAANGQREEIVLLDGKILDGRNRYEELTALGVEPRCREYDPAWGDPLWFVYSKACHRNMSETQKACAAVRIEGEFAKAAANRKSANGGNKAEVEPVPLPVKAKARDQAGHLFGVSGRYVQDAKLLYKEAPKLFRSCFDGHLPITRAKREHQRAERAKTLHAKARVAKAIDTTHIQILTGDCLDGVVPERPPRMIFCDPPYNIGIDYGEGKLADRLGEDEYLQHVDLWISAAHARLSDDGSLWWMISDEYAAETATIIREAGFTVQNWIKWYETFGVNCAGRFNRTSRHLFYCTKHPTRRVWHPEAVNRPSDRQAKYGDARANPHGKVEDDVWIIPRLVDNAAERVPGPADGKPPTQIPLEIVRRAIECSTDPGDLVMDFFCGSGTTAHQCLLSGRKFIGWEINRDYVAIARLRVQAAAADLATQKEVA